MKRFTVLLSLLVFSVLAIAQYNGRIIGQVVDENGEPMIGVAVVAKGTTNGTITDMDGAFVLDVTNTSTIEFSYVGYLTQTAKAAPDIHISLKPDVQNLEELVVVGYGAAKMKDLTSPIEVVKGEQLVATPTSSAMAALQGKVAGVQINNSGTPGSAPTVRIRGVGSFANTNPLYVVDGMFYDDIQFLNNADIEEMSIMKDASAAAIYGVRAANGVVIITTKRGKQNDKPQVTYDGYVGVQMVSNRVQMANSNQYAEMMMEADPTTFEPFIAASVANYGGTYDATAGTYNLGANTDWYAELIRPAVITNHSLNVTGGTEKASYGIAMSYIYQNGVMNTSKNDYQRTNFRGNIEYKPWKYLTVGFNGVFSNSVQQLPNNAAWQQAYNMPGLFPVKDPATAALVTDGYASPATLGYASNFYNPVATANFYDAQNKNNQVLANIYAQVNMIPDKFNFRTSYSYDYQSWRGVDYTPVYFISTNQLNNVSALSKTMSNYNNWVWDNTLTYSDSWGEHALTAMLGLSLREQSYAYLRGYATNVPAGKDSYKYLSLGDATSLTAGDDGYRYRALSYFGRVTYNYADRYMISATLRRDGSSKYNEKWGTFPSVGLGWVLSNEEWLKNVDGVDYLKLRASWGMLGNDKVPASFGANSAVPASAVFGTNTALTGFINTSNFSWLSWEVVNETNVGTNFAFFDNRLTGDIDWYYRLTQNAVVSPKLPMQNATTTGNWGLIMNMGVDVNLNWEHKVNNDWTYFIGGNMSWLRNRVLSLSDDVDMIKEATVVQKVGEKMNSFYGYEVEGIYQTAAEIAADPIGSANGCQPGDFKYRDLNGDGVLDSNDQTVLGSYVPDWMYGINLGFKYKGLDFTVTMAGQAGGELFNRKRALRYAANTYNFDYAQYQNRWNGEGTSNTDPSAAALVMRSSWNVGSGSLQHSSYFIESADYFRIQNITIGYTWTNVGGEAYKMPSIRISASADKPFTFFKANAMTPELSNANGWDTEVYPLTSTYSFALQLKF